MTTLFVSDLHLDDAAPHVTTGFAAFIERETPHAAALYILGDLAETWIGDDDDSANAATVRRALTDAARRCPTYLMHGNRDFLFGERLAAQTGAQLIEDPHIITVAGNRVLLAHGDAYCTADVEYQRARALFRSPGWQRETLARPLAERREMARQLRAQSRAANANKADNIMDVTERELATALQKRRCSVMVHGHTHRPGIHDVPLPDGEVARRYVLGDWGRCGWALRMGDETTLECFALAAGD